MPGNTTNTTNGTAGGGAPPIFGDGGGGFPGARGLEVARNAIRNVMDGLSGAATSAFEGLQTALRSLGATTVDPETAASATEVLLNL